MLEKIKISIAKTEEEFLQVYQLRYSVFATEQKDYRYANIQEQICIDKLDNSNHIIFIAAYKGKIVGTKRLAIRKNEVFIGDEFYDFKGLANHLKISLEELITSVAVLQKTVVHKDFRNIGVASQIYKSIVDYCFQNDFKILLVGVKASEQKVISSWLKKGWTIFKNNIMIENMQFILLLKKLYD